MEIIVRSKSPYFVEGPAQIGLSGGRSSAYMIDRIMRAHNGKLPSDVHVCFLNTGKERKETLVFIDACGKFYNIPIIYLEYAAEYGADLPRYKEVSYETASMESEPFNKMLAYYEAYRKAEKDADPILPNFANKMCSAYLKTKGVQWYMHDFFGYDQWDNWVGIRWDEPNRYHKFMASNAAGRERWETRMPMYEDRVTKEIVNTFWKMQPFDLGIDSDMGNCDLCFKKKPEKILKAIAAEPWRADWWIEQEERTGKTFRFDQRSYKSLKFTALQLANQQSFVFDTDNDNDVESLDCACTD